MAYEARRLSTDDEQVDQQMASTSGPTTLTSAPATTGASPDGATATGSLTTSGAASAPAGAAPTTSGRFTNLQQFIESNRPQAEQLGERVAGAITGKAGEARTAIQQAQTGFQGEVAKNTPQYQQELIQRALADPVAAQNDPELMQVLTNMRTGTYTGPGSLTESSSFAPAEQQVQRATQAADLAQTSAGRTQLLRNLVQGPMTRGGLSLDQLLLQNQEGARNRVLTAAEEARPVQTELQKAQEAAARDVEKARTAATETNRQFREAFTGGTGAIPSFRSELDTRVAQQRERVGQQQQALRQSLATAALPGTRQVTRQEAVPATTRFVNDTPGGRTVVVPATTRTVTENVAVPAQPLDPATLQQLGISQAQFDNLMQQRAQAQAVGGATVPLENFLTLENPEAIVSRETVATPQEIARYQALARIAGVDPTTVTSNVPQTSPTRFDLAGLQNTLLGQIQAGQTRSASAAQTQALIDAQNAAAKPSAVDRVVNVALSPIRAVFCFVGGTPIVMSDGTTKRAQDIEIGDHTLLGGFVSTVAKSIADSLYVYHGVHVQGGHKVLCEDGVWRRVQDAPGAEIVDLGGNSVFVYTLVNTNHLVVVNDVIFADFVEVDDADWTLNSEGRMNVLNGNTERNKQLLDALFTVFPEKKVA